MVELRKTVNKGFYLTCNGQSINIKPLSSLARAEVRNINERNYRYFESLSCVLTSAIKQPIVTLRNTTNKEIDDVWKDIEKYYNINLTINSRKTKYVVLRTLFFYICKNLLDLNDQFLEDWVLRNKGLKRDRSSIYCSLTKMDLYLKNYPYVGELYYKYFPKDADIDEIKTNEISNSFTKIKAITESIKDYPEDYLSELEEMIYLKVKSWEWKSKDKCEIINCQL